MPILCDVTIAFDEYGSLSTLATIITIDVLGGRLAGIVVIIIVSGRLFGIWFRANCILCTGLCSGFLFWVCMFKCVCVVSLSMFNDDDDDDEDDGVVVDDWWWLVGWLIDCFQQNVF